MDGLLRRTAALVGGLVLAGLVTAGVASASLTAGVSHTCGLTPAGGAMCWGGNASGQLGDGTTTGRPVPADVTGLTGGVARLAAGSDHSCALTSGGGVKCWGRSAAIGNGESSSTPQPIPSDVTALPNGVVALAAGESHTCAVMAGGGVKCWGYNVDGQLGDGTNFFRAAPVDVPGLPGAVVAIAAGGAHSCALSATGGVACWGANGSGQLGDNSTTARLAPVAVEGLPAGVVAIAAGRNHTCALTAGGGAKCWGDNSAGQLGDGTTTGRPAPVDVSGLAGGVAALATGGAHTCALMSGGGMKCWGRNASGQVGDGSTTDRLSPADVTGIAGGIAAIAAGNSHSCALAANGTARCWGANAAGQLGDGTTVDRAVPTAVTGFPPFDTVPDAFAFTPVLGVAPGSQVTSNAITVTGITGASPVSVAGGEYSIGCTPTFTSTSGTIAPGEPVCVRHTAAATGGGSVATTLTIGGVSAVFSSTTGLAQAITFAPLLDRGLGTPPFALTARASSGLPVAFTSDTPSVCVVSSSFVTVLSTGTCTIAANQAGNAAFRPAPQVVRSFTAEAAVNANDVVAIAAGGGHTCALTGSGAAKCWGANLNGQLGDGTNATRLVPVDVLALANGVAALSAGGAHTCALTTVGAVKCWGQNTYGQLGDGTTTDRLAPVDVIGLSGGVVAIAAGGLHTCAITTAGGVKCWGLNTWGALGDGTTSDRLVPVDVAGLPGGVVALSGGNYHTCALAQGGSLKCWGYGLWGQLGNDSTANSSVPVDVTALPGGVTAIAMGGNFSCALAGGSATLCWGRNLHGQLGDGSTVDRLEPVAVVGLAADVVALAAEDRRACALDEAGALRCWGWNQYGQLGDGSRTDRLTPVAVLGMSGGVSAVAAGALHTCALMTSGAVRCWGSNDMGQIGDGTTEDRLAPAAVAGLGGLDTTPDPIAFAPATGVAPGSSVTSDAATISGIAAPALVSVSGGTYSIGCTGPFIDSAGTISNGQSVCVRHTAAATGGGSVSTTITIGGVSAVFTSTAKDDRITQSILFGELPDRGMESPPFQLVATASSGLSVVFAPLSPLVCTVSDRTLTIVGAGTCFVQAFQPGNAIFAPAAPVTRFFKVTAIANPSSDPNDVTAITAGLSHTCARTSAGGVKCWGRNRSGPLGDGTQTDRTTPVDVTGLTNGVPAVAAGGESTCAIATAGGVQCWGWNGSGQLGDGTQTDRTTPVDVSGLANGVLGVAVGGGHTCALTAAGGVKCWGWNRSPWTGGGGQLGDGTQTDRLTPVDVSGLASGVVAVTAGDDHTCALTTAGGVKCWGGNASGQLGDGTLTDRLTPVDVSGLASGVIAITAGSRHTCALTTTGAAKCWGLNAFGQLGDGTLTVRLTPVGVSGLTSGAVAITAGTHHTCAITSAGGAKCWGDNTSGQLGDGTRTSLGGSPDRTTPVDVIGLTSGMVAVAAGTQHTCAITIIGSVKCWGFNGEGRLGDGTSNESFTPVDVFGLDGIDRDPDAFTLGSRAGVLLSTVQVSDAVVPAGYFDPAPIAVTGGQYSIGCNGTFTSAPGTILPGQSVCVRHAASPFNATAVVTTLTVGTTAATFTSTTGEAPPVLVASPPALAFGNLALGSTNAAQGLTITNVGAQPATGLGLGVNGDFAIVSTTCGTVLATGASCTVMVSFKPTVVGLRADDLIAFAGNLPEPLHVVLSGTGTASDVTPNTFAFTDQFLVAPSTVITSAPVQVTGLTGAATVSVANGSYCVSGANSCSSCTFRQDPSTITDGQYLCARHTSSPIPGGQVDTLVFVGGLGDAFTSITIDTVPAAFSFPSVSGVQPATVQASSAAAIVGINAPAPVSVTGGEYSVGCTGTWTSTAGTVTNGQTVCVRHVAAGSYSATNTTTLSIGGVTGAFVTTTAPATSIPRLGNISTRMQVLTGNDVLIGGFIIGGSAPKTVVVRARGPSLAPFGITNFLANPMLQLYSGQTPIAANDDWGTATNAAALQASGFAPEIAQESAILITLNPGAYTAIVSGVGGGTGVGIVEVFEVDLPEVPLANISTRGSVLTGNDVMIGGFVIQGDRPQTVIVRARGPSLADFGITNPLANPVLQLFSGQTMIAMNDNWQSSAEAGQIQSRGFAPASPFESAILITLNPGAYTAIVTGAGGTTGVGIIEVFAQ